MAKSTKIEVYHRVNTCYKMLAEAKSRTQILRFCSDKWGITERQAETYLARAREKLLEDVEMERPAWISEALARLRTYEQAAYNQKQNQTAINSVQAQAKLIGIDL